MPTRSGSEGPNPVPLLVIPHLQKQQGESLNRLALHHQSVVLPMAVFFIGIDVFVRQIDATGEGGAAIDDKNFPVVPIVVVGGHQGAHRGEEFALDAQFFQLFGVAGREGGDGAGSIV